MSKPRPTASIRVYWLIGALFCVLGILLSKIIPLIFAFLIFAMLLYNRALEQILSEIDKHREGGDDV